MKILSWGSENFKTLSPEKNRGGGSENLYTSKLTGGGGLLKNITASEGGC